MLVQYEAVTHKSGPTVLVGEASISKVKDKRARRWKRKKGKGKAIAVTASAAGAPTAPVGMGKGKEGRSNGAIIFNNLQVLERRKTLNKDEVILRPGDGKIWHTRLGHISKDRMRKLAGHKESKGRHLDNLPTCEYYLKRKMTKKPFVGQSVLANGLLDLIPTNVYGSLNTLIRGGYSYFITFIDNHSRYGYPMRHKSEAFGRFKEYRLEVRIKLAVRILGLTSQLDNDLRTYGEAISDIDSDKWFEAMRSEMDPMGSNQVWTLVDPPKGVKPIRCKWVYKHKLGADGEVIAFKARLVEKGYTQRPRINFEETYSPIAIAKSIWILLAIAAWYDFEKWQMDVKTAFLNSFIEEEIYMDKLESFTSVGEEQKDMSEAFYILWLKIYRDRSIRILGLTQSSYIEKSLENIQDGDLKLGLLPMRHGIKLSKNQSPKTNEELKRMSNTPYASAVGSIQYGV
ncbi:Retrovirus-related Pol polyprotein from transposon RE2 [Sesamum angolense]|uniref:Retrovirus-related Pol polyprotein from transposon RE2 n=1 Tax=Sesamum angolense TaxID=2727404 RepID=A0AAE1XHL1_9LAMI|nr:Retrovirus-related Pol polyprotein from transposon RE2 [Sesamum angolense]